jgi:hypothetical protein
MLYAAFLLVGFEAFLFIAQPNYIGPMMAEPPPIWTWLLPVFGVAAQAIGLAWMIRIYRTDPEGHRSWWRFDPS